jgi:hypothetical protein
MKVFWSWQSDHPGKISRHFVREALEGAIDELNQEKDIEEPERDYALDHDRKDIPGSPDLASTILSKIEKSDVFVADVTPVGHTKNGKALINSNVAIELGYALRTLSDKALLMVFNEAFGTRDDLPFDLRHKAGPIMYRLEATSSKKEIEAAKRALKSELKIHLAGMAKHSAPVEAPVFQEQFAPDWHPGSYFGRDEVLAHRNGVEFKCQRDRLCFIRVIPSRISAPLSRTVAGKAADAGDLRPLDFRASGWSMVQNEFGLVVFYGDNEAGQVMSATQIFKNREVWGFDANYLYAGPQSGQLAIPTGVHERLFAKGLRKYVEFATHYLEVDFPISVILGVTNVRGHMLAMPRARYWDDFGPLHEDNIIVRKKLLSGDDEEIDRVLLNFFEAIFDAAGTERPEGFNKFPGEKPGAVPAQG